jgi:hypothetical protein
MAVEWQITIDCADPAKLAEFWVLALGYELEPPPPGFASWEEWAAHLGAPEGERDNGASVVDPEAVGPRLVFQQVPEPKVGKNRLHLDVKVGGGRTRPWEERWARVTEAVDRLTAAGAAVVSTHELRGRPDHVVMADPEGNEFCLV